VSHDCDDFLLAALRGAATSDAARGHRASCGRCAGLAPALPEVERTLRALDDAAPPPDLAARVLAAAAPLLVANAQAERGQRATAATARFDGVRLATALVPAVLLFPLLVLADVLLLRLLHGLLATLLPQPVTTYLVASYAALLAALVCLTFGAIPLLVQRQGAAPWKEGHV
jgi:hypothetical protein